MYVVCCVLFFVCHLVWVFLNSHLSLTCEMGRCLMTINLISVCNKHGITPKYMKWMIQGFCVVLSCRVPSPWTGCFLHKCRCYSLVHLLMPSYCIVLVSAMQNIHDSANIFTSNKGIPLSLFFSKMWKHNRTREGWFLFAWPI